MARIYIETIKKWATKIGIAGGTVVALIFSYLIFMNYITVISHSGDMVCAGTIEDSCLADMKFLANENIFLGGTI